MKVVQFFCMSLVDRPSFTAIEQCGDNYGLIHLEFHHLGDSSSVLNILVKSAESNARFSESGVHFIIDENVSRK